MSNRCWWPLSGRFSQITARLVCCSAKCTRHLARSWARRLARIRKMAGKRWCCATTPSSKNVMSTAQLHLCCAAAFPKADGCASTSYPPPRWQPQSITAPTTRSATGTKRSLRGSIRMVTGLSGRIAKSTCTIPCRSIKTIPRTSPKYSTRLKRRLTAPDRHVWPGTERYTRRNVHRVDIPRAIDVFVYFKGGSHMITQPRLEQRDEQPYVGIRTQVPTSKFKEIIPQFLDELFAWLGQRGVKPAGAPF